MKRTKEIFQRQRELEEFEPFDHKENFCKKVKQNWLSNEEFGTLESKSLIELTQVLIDKEMDSEYMDELMKIIDEKEPKYIKKDWYFELIRVSPLENMQRIYKKYDGVEFLIQSVCKHQLEFYIGEKKRKLRECNDCDNYAEYDGALKYCSVCGKKLN
jgi:hypothetical protein